MPPLIASEERIKGFCKTCDHLRREWVFVQKTDGTYGLELDSFCALCEMFKRPFGYCDMWEPRPNDW